MSRVAECFKITLTSLAMLVGTDVTARAADDYVIGGDLVTLRASPISLRFERLIAGDDNRNAAVAVSYRKKGTAEWLVGPAMVRVDVDSKDASRAPF